MIKRQIVIFLAYFLLITNLYSQKSLEVVVVNPKGQTSAIDQSAKLTVVFNQPMVPLQEVPEDESIGPMIIEPPIAGKFRWMGTSTLVFLPNKVLPYSTKYSLKIPKGIKCIDGTGLTKEYIWSFETPRPKVTMRSPQDQSIWQKLDQVVILQFNQPVDSINLVDNTTLFEYDPNNNSNTRISYSFKRTNFELLKKNNLDTLLKNAFVLMPVNPLNQEKVYRIEVNPGLNGVEGNLPMLEKSVFSFSTYKYFKVVSVETGNPQDPNSYIKIKFSNPVIFSDAVKAISIEPAVKIPKNYFENDYQTAELHLRFNLKAETEYTIKIGGNLQDVFGNELVADYFHKFKTGSYSSSISMTRGYGIIEAYGDAKIPITTMNMDNIGVFLKRLDVDSIIPVCRKFDYDYNEDYNNPNQKYFQHKFDTSFALLLKTKKNISTVNTLDIQKLLHSKFGNMFFIVKADFNDKHPVFPSVVQVTELGITSKFSPDNTLIWVTCLKDATPVEGAEVNIRGNENKILWTGKTNASGIVEAPGWGELGITGADEWRPPRVWAIARKDNDVAFTNSDWGTGIWPWRFGINYDWSPKFEPVRGCVFTDRGIYRAGETVAVKGIFRIIKKGEWKIPVQHSASIVVTDSRNAEVYKDTILLSEFGSLDFSLKLKSTSATGYYFMNILVEKEKHGKKDWVFAASNNFRVEAFKPTQFEVTAKLLDKNYTVGDTVKGLVAGKYLFGGAMKFQPITWRLRTSDAYFSPPNHEGFFFGKLGWDEDYESPRTKKIVEKSDTLDKNGSLNITHILNSNEITETVLLLFEADVTSPSRQVISGKTSVVVHGGNYYIGIKPSSTFISADSVLKYLVVTTDKDGKRLKDSKLEVKIFERQWHSIHRAGVGGAYEWESEKVDVAVDSSEISINDTSGVTRTYIPKKAGFYLIRCEGNNNLGSKIISEAYFYVSGSGYVPWSRSDDDRIELVSNKKSYKPSEVASVIVKSPYEKTTALISLEREGVVKHWTAELKGSAPQIDVPITGNHLPNVFLSVVLLQGRTEGKSKDKKEDVGRPSFKIGYVNLPVDPCEKHLKVFVSTGRKEYQPGDSVTVNLSSKDFSGKGVQSEIAFSVADIGVLNLIGYKLPDAFTTFYGSRSLAVSTAETRLHLVQQRNYGEKGEDDGGGGGIEMSGDIRKDFRASAYWNPSIVADENGKAVVKFKLPDNLTSFRLMASAQSKNSEFGYDDTTITVNKPLVMHASLPSFARLGDSFEGGVLIYNYSPKKYSIKLETVTKGITLKDNPKKEFTLKPGESKELRYKYSVDKVGTAEIVFKASMGDFNDAFEWKIPIQVPAVKEANAVFSNTLDSVKEKILIPKNTYVDLGDLEFSVSSTALNGLAQAVEYLFTYPYGCLEQKLSCVLPIIMGKDLVEAFKLQVFKDKNYDEVVNKVLEDVVGFQRGDGGFAYWKSDYSTHAYLSAYAVYTLIQAEKHGYKIDKSVLKNGQRFLRERLNSAGFGSADYCTKALILYTLALSGNPDHAYMGNLFNERSRIPLFARAYLLKALSVSKGNNNFIQTLADELTNLAKVVHTSAYFEERDPFGMQQVFHSNVRTTALVMQALIETQPENSIIPRAVRWLLDNRKNGCWRTTQENIYVVDALATYFEQYEKDDPNFSAKIKIAGRDIVNEMFKGRTLDCKVSENKLSDYEAGKNYDVDISKNGSGRLYYTLRMIYYPKERKNGVDEGYSVMKTIEPLSGKSENKNEFSTGSIIKISLNIVTTEDRNYVAVDDPLPAGFEVVQTTFETESDELKISDEQQESPEEEEYDYVPKTFDHVERYSDKVLIFATSMKAGVHKYSYLARAVTSGKFILPATRAEGMYEPEVFGRTSERVITIK
jgi:alpha-2-macroglobulin